ncbi:putative Activator of Hsp90 ATPase, N-terminal [Blattamonas nauphoetae]|uniref:Activator of Hsp90 ATPase, N-terminal n=1 Tax=Blattamonas nauphoetae TaxID=2049346 RepID=A0ABQ9YLJ7_9EUKA|nr:putative Activator of Hsp90 ATPase, N-terminal [Blattamonas nauphoetae]
MSVWNPNQWHWEERPQTLWSKTRIPELFREIAFPLEGGTLTIPEVDSIEGDAVINIRKGKRIISYELKITSKWSGQIGEGDSAKKETGKIEMPYVCEDVDDMNFEVKVKADNSNSTSKKMMDIILANKSMINDKLKQWVEEMRTKELQ